MASGRLWPLAFLLSLLVLNVTAQDFLQNTSPVKPFDVRNVWITSADEPRPLEARVAPLLAKASSSEIEKARAAVLDAIEKAAIKTKARFEHMARNHYGLKPGTKISRHRRDAAADLQAPPPRYEVTADIAALAALVAEADAAASNITSRTIRERAGTYWMEGLARKGSVPWGNDPSYKVGHLLEAS